jgi:predicted PurR-regulated permease PerM
MSIQSPSIPKLSANQSLESSIQIGLAALLAIGCLIILYPFIPLILWGIIIAVASHPTFLKLQRILKGRAGWTAVLWTLLLLAVLIVPLVLIGGRLVEGIRPVIDQLRNGSLEISPPPDSVQSWPLIGKPVYRAWESASRDLGAVIAKYAPEIKSALPGILAASLGLGSTAIQFLLAILLSGLLLANAPAASAAVRLLMIRLFGADGPEYQQLIGATIRSVTFGVLGVALIQTAFATVGFLVVGLPGAAGWSIVFLFAAVVQIGVVVLVPAVILVFATASTTKAVLFLLWCVIVGLLDNILKPILLGRGAAVPLAVVFLGVLGGFIAMGIVGLFVGAVVLSVGYKLGAVWLRGGASPEEPVNSV